MNLKYLLLPVIAVCLGSSVQAQSPDTSPSTSPSPGFEEHGGGWHHHHGGWLFRKLNLTDTQREALKSLRASIRASSDRAAFRSALLNYLQAKAALENAVSQNNPDLSSLATNLANAQSQLILLRAQRREQLQTQLTNSKILTPEQQQIWNEFQQKKAARLQDRINELKSQTNS
jgi:Spy/CpxP family protein refolding chaperone